jgi:hypothetical protein
LALLTENEHARFETARRLASRSAQQVLTAGQTITAMMDVYLAGRDPLRRRSAPRRMPHTATLPNSRRVPAAVDRAVRARSEDKCAIKSCRNGIFVHRSHRTPHREGGTREEDNLDLLCARHHALFEQGMIRLSGPPEARVFTDASGNVLGYARKPEAPEKSAIPETPDRRETRDRPGTQDPAP